MPGYDSALYDTDTYDATTSGSTSYGTGTYGTGTYGIGGGTGGGVGGGTPLSQGFPTLTPSSTTVLVTWPAATGGTAPYTYRVQRAPNVSGSPGTYANIGSSTSSLSYNDSGLTASTGYWYRIVATDSTATTATSTGAFVTTLAIPSGAFNVICQISFVDPRLAPVWQDVSARVQSFSTKRGRSFELDRIDAGTATIVLDNRDHALDPTNSGGPYFGNILSMRRIRLGLSFSGTTYWMFTGYIESYPQESRVYDDAWSTLAVVDGFKVFSLYKLDGYAVPQQLVGARLNNILDFLGWPSGDRRIDVGQSTLQATTVTDEVLSHLQVCAVDSELGRFFIGTDGAVVFLDRSRPGLPPYNTVQASFGEDAGQLLYVDILPTYSDDNIWNHITVTRNNGGAPQIVGDTTSDGHFYQRALEKNVEVSTDAAALSLAQGLLINYKDQHYRFDQITLDPWADPTNLWPQILGREIGDRIRVQKRWPTGVMIQQEVFIESISHQWDASQSDAWQTVWSLGPATGTYWTLGVAGASELGQTTYAAW